MTDHTAISKFFNMAKMDTATTGTGTMTLGSAVAGFLSFANAGVANGDAVTYCIIDGTDFELGQGIYTSSGTTLSRLTVYASSNSGSKISLSGSAKVHLTMAKDDLAALPRIRPLAPHTWWRIKVLKVATNQEYLGGEQCYFYDQNGTLIDVKNTATEIFDGCWDGYYGNVTALFDGVGNTEYASKYPIARYGGGNFVEGIVGFNYPTAVQVNSWAWKSHSSYMGRAPKDVVLEYSDDGFNWRPHQRWTGQTWSSGETKTFTCNANSIG